MIIRRSINKEEVKDMPKAVFPGQIHVVQTPQEAERAVAYLKKCSILGIDSETRPSFTKGQSHKVALLQISSEEHCFLFRLNLTGFKRYMPSFSEKRFQRASACPTGKPMC